MSRLALPALLLATVCSSLAAEDWYAWRGPTGQGFSSEKNVLQRWSDKENVKWKIPLANQGNSTPITWGDRIFLTQANAGGSVRSLLCLARADGKLLWQQDVAYDAKERNWNQNWYCNASPTTDGQRVVVSFGSAGMFCYDFSGKEIWKRDDLGPYEHAYGNSSSPVLYGDTVILWTGPNEGGKGRNDLLAVNKATGETVWEVKEKGGSWGTPLITKVDGQDQLLLGIPDRLKGYDPKTGAELWSCDGLTRLVYTSALFGNGIAVSMSGYGGAALAVKLGGSGDITSSRLWHHPRNTQRVGSGMIVGDHVYMVEESGIPHCYNLETGEEVWKIEKRPGAGNTWGSMVHAEGRLYVLMRNAETLVFAASPNYELIATNSLGPGEQTNSSIVISNGEILIRTFKHLYCLGAPAT
jgi:outer membrane protein assembly factor BamB